MPTIYPNLTDDDNSILEEFWDLWTEICER